MARDDFAAMIAAPEDDAPRLVWADGRLEAGDPHGEFVATQCALARIGLEPPRLHREWLLDGLASEEKSSKRVAKLKQRESALLRAHGPEWAGAAHAFKAWGQTSEWLFRRGFVEQLGVRAQSLAEAFEAAPLLRTVYWFEEATAARIREVFAVRAATRLRELYLPNVSTELRSLAGIAELAPLRRLVLNHTGGAHDLAAIARAPFHATLAGLVVSSMALDASIVRTTFGSARALEELQLVDTRLGATGVAALAAIELPRLEVLSLRHGKIGDDGARALAGASFMARVRALDLRKNSLQDVSVVLDAAPQLAVLALAGNRLRGSLSAFLDARAPIDVLDLQECDLGDDDVTALVASPVWQHVGVLDLRSNRLGPAAAKRIADAPARLRTLYIGGNALGPEGKAALKTLPARVHA